MTDKPKPSTLIEAAAEVRRVAKIGATPSNEGSRADTEWFHKHPLNSVGHEKLTLVADWLTRLVPAGTTAGDDRLAAATRLLLSEVRAQSGHLGRPLEDLLGDGIHDRRMKDGGCMVCALIAIAEHALEPADPQP